MLEQMKKNAIFIIIFFAFLARLPYIDSSIVGRHSWRQADTAAIARNFAVEEYNIMHPRIDWRGATSGYVEAEFQLYPFIVASIYKAAGVHIIKGI